MLRHWPATLIIATLVASASLQGWRVRHLPVDAEVAAVAAAVRQGFRAGDLVVVEPPWMVGPRLLLGDLPLLEPRRLDRDDLLGVHRVWLVQVESIGGDLGLGTALLAMGTTVSAQELESVRLRLIELVGAGRLVFDLRAGLEAAVVSARYADGTDARCERFDRDRWICPRDPGWSYVGRKTLDIDGQPRDCVWMHPVAAGGELRIELPNLPRLSAARLETAFGFTADAAHRAAAPVTVSLRQGEEVLGEQTFPVAPGWRRWPVPLASSDGRVALVLRSSNNGAAHFCGMVRVVEEGG